MANEQLKNAVDEILKGYPEIWNDGERNDTKLFDLLDQGDEELIGLLLTNKTTKAKFFKKIGDAFIFKGRDFQFFIQENKVFNSYTQYKNRIGLSDGKRFLKDSGDVVLNFPFKDCVLEGGQSTEEGKDIYYEPDKDGTYKKKTSNRKEIFFNEILAQDEIDRLLDPKALVNWHRYTKDGVEEVNKIKRDENEEIKENLIIKGNNLLALHSIKEQFSGKVKLIYIDPPYNTGGDANIFTYNNKFNHSTWLTFIKNRLEISKELIREDGFIAIAIDHFELFYLGTMADEIFGRDNRLGLISVIHKPEGRQFANFFSPSNEFMLVYAKNRKDAKFENVVLDEEKTDEFNQEDEIGKFKLKNFIRLTDGKYSLRKNKPDGFYPIYVSRDLKKFSLEKKSNYEEALPITDKGVERVWKTYGDTFMDKVQQNLIIAERENGKIVLYEKLRPSQVLVTHWHKKKYHAYHYGTKLLEEILGRKDFSYPKSLHVVMDALKLMTSGNDVILDFHAGSGTTGHATLKLNKEDGGNRKFILVEQLDEHIKICKERMQKTMQQEGIDESFIYCELAKWNEKAKEKIANYEDHSSLKDFFDELCNRYFLHYNLRIDEFQEKILQEQGFKALSLSEQKAIFAAMLDNNQMYVNKTEMNDSRFNIDEVDQALTRKFYDK